MPPKLAGAWMDTPQAVLEGQTPAAVLNSATDEITVLDAYALVVGIAVTLRACACGYTGMLDEDGRCECGHYPFDV